MRRRARFLRKARELAYRDLGGLVYNLHHFGKRNDTLVLAKLDTIGRIDTELRALETALSEHRPVTILTEAGIAACPRCAAIHGSDDRFCPNCGLAMDLRADRPVAGAPSSTPVPPPSTFTPAPAAVTPGPGPVKPTPAPAAGAPPAPATPPAPAGPAPAGPASAGPAPADPAPAGPVPAGPAPATRPDLAATPAAGGSAPEPSAPGRAPSVEEPTEIIRPPVESP
jgi:hypothetical protein